MEVKNSIQEWEDGQFSPRVGSSDSISKINHSALTEKIRPALKP